MIHCTLLVSTFSFLCGIQAINYSKYNWYYSVFYVYS